MDRDKLLKLLRLTTSDKIHEVAGAMRAANRMLEASGETWEDVIAGPTKSFKVEIFSQRPYKAEETEGTWVAPHLKDKVIIDTMFRAVYSQPRTGSEDFWRWVDDVHNKWERHRVLTPNQYVALRKCYMRATSASPAT